MMQRAQSISSGWQYLLWVALFLLTIITDKVISTLAGYESDLIIGHLGGRMAFQTAIFTSIASLFTRNFRVTHLFVSSVIALFMIVTDTWSLIDEVTRPILDLVPGYDVRRNLQPSVMLVSILTLIFLARATYKARTVYRVFNLIVLSLFMGFQVLVHNVIPLPYIEKATQREVIFSRSLLSTADFMEQCRFLQRVCYEGKYFADIQEYDRRVSMVRAAGFDADQFVYVSTPVPPETCRQTFPSLPVLPASTSRPHSGRSQ